MEEICHFSHDHPLTTFVFVDDDDDQRDNSCSICGLPILSSPSYTCTINGCNFFLHKPCAELPENLDNPRHHPIVNSPHTVYLKQQWSSGYSYLNQSKLSHNFTYKCSVCKFEMPPLLAVPVKIKSKHKSHQLHPLVAICRTTLSLCDACGELQTGFFFSCQECNFWIHQDCTTSPSILTLASHPHPFILTYSLSNALDLLPPKCIICEGSMFVNVGLYFCSECASYAHVSCARLNMKSIECGLELIQLPADDGGIYRGLAIGRSLQRNAVLGDKDLALIEKYHMHQLELSDHGFSSSSNLVCDVCVQPIIISSPFYRCLELNCHFLVHETCAILPPRVEISLAGDVLIEAFPYPYTNRGFFSSIYPCLYCRRPCNGFGYSFDNRAVRAFFDLECAIAPSSVKHTSHGRHVLFRTSRMSETIPLRCCSEDTVFHDVYRCVTCDDFYIHVRCSLLPTRTRHKYDEHPLKLITHSHEHQYNSCCFCEFCEKDIDQQYWYYGCHKCEHYFHINCIPSVGYLSKVKFGKTLGDKRTHHHPLTLTRMLTVGRNEMCAHCKNIIRGFVDEMAFHCSNCDFWIHFSCARDSSGAAHETSTQLRLYSEDQEKIEIFFRNHLIKERNFSSLSNPGKRLWLREFERQYKEIKDRESAPTPPWMHTMAGQSTLPQPRIPSPLTYGGGYRSELPLFNPPPRPPPLPPPESDDEKRNLSTISKHMFKIFPPKS